MKIRMITYLKVNNMAEFVNRNNFKFSFFTKTTVKVYNEMRDMMLLIPRKCVEFAS